MQSKSTFLTNELWAVNWTSLRAKTYFYL